MMAAMTDMATVASVFSTANGTGEIFNGTVELNLSVLRPVVGAGTVVDVVADVTRKGKGIVFADCKITDVSRGELVGNGRIVYALGVSKTSQSKL
jgi:acyl-coenzyme A thioesterase PaaI-like protein